VEGHGLAHVLGDVVEVGAVALRQDHVGEPAAWAASTFCLRPSIGSSALESHLASYDSSVSHKPEIDPYAGLPGADLVAEGVRDLAAGVESVPALLVSVAASRLTAVGLEVAVPSGRPAHRLYDLLAADNPRTAHSRYNALVGRLASFARAAERATAR